MNATALGLDLAIQTTAAGFAIRREQRSDEPCERDALVYPHL